MPVLNDAQDILPAFGIPAFKIAFLSISRQIHETTLAALHTGKRLCLHFLSSPVRNIQKIPMPVIFTYKPSVFDNRISERNKAMIRIPDAVQSGY
jgi:hypothetical protein